MADQTPLRAIFDDSGKVTGLGQYQLSDTIAVSYTHLTLPTKA